MSRLLAIIAIAAVSICGGSSAFAEGHGGGGQGHSNMGHGDGGHFGRGHGGGFQGGGFGGPGIGFSVAPAYYDYGYDSGCYQLQRVWTGRRWQMRRVQVC